MVEQLSPTRKKGNRKERREQLFTKRGKGKEIREERKKRNSDGERDGASLSPSIVPLIYR
jgi:hypothetical protein